MSSDNEAGSLWAELIERCAEAAYHARDSWEQGVDPDWKPFDEWGTWPDKWHDEYRVMAQAVLEEAGIRAQAERIERLEAVARAARQCYYWPRREWFVGEVDLRVALEALNDAGQEQEE